MSFPWIVISIGFVLVVILGAINMILQRAIRRKHGPARQGTEPGDGQTVLTTTFRAGGVFSNGWSTKAWTVPKDPQEYAKGFVPGNRHRND